MKKNILALLITTYSDILIKIISIIGTRPQIIKFAAIHNEISRSNLPIYHKWINTGQHYDPKLNDDIIRELDLPQPDHQIDSNPHSSNRIEEISAICTEILKTEKPNFVLLYGDTDSTYAGTIAALNSSCKIAHVEAGMRSYNSQMPEEKNRIFCDQHADLHFTASKTAQINLIKEGFDPIFTGDVMFDNFLNHSVEEKAINRSDSYAILTIHRNYNTDKSENLSNILSAILEFANEQGLKIIFPTHPRTLKTLNLSFFVDLLQKIKAESLIDMVEPFSYLEMQKMLKHTSLVITDSGGLQKEAYFSKTPSVIIRTETEWTEILETGMATLAFGSKENIKTAINSMLSKSTENSPQLFGDGQASKYICQELLKGTKTKRK